MVNRKQFKLNTIDETAKQIERDPKTVRAYFSDGIIGGRRIAGRIYISDADIKTFFRGKQNGKSTNDKRGFRENKRRTRKTKY